MRTLKLGMLVAPLLVAASVAWAAGADYSSPSSIDSDEWYNSPVMNSQGEELGRYGGLVNAHGGSVYYVLMNSSGDPTKVWAIPSNYLQVDPSQRVLIMDAQPTIFERAPLYSTDVNPEDPTWEQETRAYYQDNAHDYGDFGAVDSSRGSIDPSSDPASDGAGASQGADTSADVDTSQN